MVRQIRWVYGSAAILTLLFGHGFRAWAYGPIFVPHYQVPGEGGVNLLTDVHDSVNGVEWENGIGYGVNRALAVNLMGTLMMENPAKEGKAVDLNHVDIEVLWRAMNFDSFQTKRAIVFNMNNRFSSNKNDSSGYDLDDDVSGSVGYLEDHLHWIGILDFRVDRASDSVMMAGMTSKQMAPKTAGWVDSVLGWRFYNNPETLTDAMWTLDLNGRVNQGAVLYVGSELIYQPHQTMLFKAGYRYPVAHQEDIEADAIPGGLWAYEMEFRF